MQQRGNRADIAFPSVAVDVEPERVRPFAQGLPFPTAVDSTGQLGRLFDFDVVPNGLVVDAGGTIRLLHIAGFDVRRPEVAAQVAALLDTDPAAGEQPSFLVQEPISLELLRAGLAGRPDDAGLHFALGEALLHEGRQHDAEVAFRRAVDLDAGEWSARFGLGTAQYQQGRTNEALASWQAALALDPPNFTVRKQIWMVQHPSGSIRRSTLPGSGSSSNEKATCAESPFGARLAEGGNGRARLAAGNRLRAVRVDE